MKDFLFVFRADYNTVPKGTQEEMEAMTKRWMDWIGRIASENKLTDRGNRLTSTGKVVRSDSTITNGPYTEIKETIGGYSVIKADSYETALDIAKNCPIFNIGGNVEIREISVL